MATYSRRVIRADAHAVRPVVVRMASEARALATGVRESAEDLGLRHFQNGQRQGKSPSARDSALREHCEPRIGGFHFSRAWVNKRQSPRHSTSIRATTSVKGVTGRRRRITARVTIELARLPDLTCGLFPVLKMPFQVFYSDAGDDVFKIMSNAWSLAQASELVYKPAEVVKATAENLWGLKEAIFIDGAADTQCFVAATEDIILLCFRGSQEEQDWEQGFDTALVPWDGTAGEPEVHRGFKECLDKEEDGSRVRTVIVKHINNLQKKHGGTKILPIFVTGHSLGAACATVATAYLRNPDNFEDEKLQNPVKALYTFGSPRVGTSNFVKKFKDGLAVHRFQNSRDPFTRLPFFYHSDKSIPLPLRVGKALFKFFDNYVHVNDREGMWWKTTDGGEARVFSRAKHETKVVGGLVNLFSMLGDTFVARSAFPDHNLHKGGLPGKDTPRGYIEGLEKNVDRFYDGMVPKLLSAPEQMTEEEKKDMEDAWSLVHGCSQPFERFVPRPKSEAVGDKPTFDVLANAWSLARACEAAEQENGGFYASVSGWGLEKGNESKLEGGKTQCVVAENNDIILVVLKTKGPTRRSRRRRGTRGRKAHGPGSNGKIYSPFRSEIEGGAEGKSILSQVTERVRRLRNSSEGSSRRAVYVTGHGWGGALATLAAADMLAAKIDVTGLYTFGSPPVGDSSFKNLFESSYSSENGPTQTHHFKNRKDFMTIISPFAGSAVEYEHVGRQWTLKGNTQIIGNDTNPFKKEDMETEKEKGFRRILLEKFWALRANNFLANEKADHYLRRVYVVDGYIEAIENTIRRLSRRGQ